MRAVARRFLRERCRQPELRAADLATAQLDPLAEIEKQAKSGDLNYTRFLERLEQMAAASASVGAALTRRVSRPHPAEAFRVGAATGRPPEVKPHRLPRVRRGGSYPQGEPPGIRNECNLPQANPTRLP